MVADLRVYCNLRAVCEPFASICEYLRSGESQVTRKWLANFSMPIRFGRLSEVRWWVEEMDDNDVQVLEIPINFVLNLAGLEIIRDRFLLSFGLGHEGNENLLCSFHPCTVDRIDFSPGSSGNIGCRWFYTLRQVKTIRKMGKIAYLKFFGVNFITYIHPRSFALVKKVLVSMCQVGFIMREETRTHASGADICEVLVAAEISDSQVFNKVSC